MVRSMTNKMLESLKKEVSEHLLSYWMTGTGIFFIILLGTWDPIKDIENLYYYIAMFVGVFGCLTLGHLFRMDDSITEMKQMLEELQHEKAAEERPDDD